MKHVLVFLIQVWRYTIGTVLPPACRFQPSCSAYAIEAVTRYGAGRGVVLAARRLLRCHPFSVGGYDPVP